MGFVDRVRDVVTTHRLDAVADTAPAPPVAPPPAVPGTDPAATLPPVPGAPAALSAGPAGANGAGANGAAAPSGLPAVLGQPPSGPPEVATTTSSEFDRAVPRGLQVAAAWSWRLIVVAAFVYLLGRVLGYLSEAVIPVAIAILLTALLAPVAARLRSWGLPHGLATVLTVLGGIALIVGALTLIINSIVDQAGELSSNVTTGFDNLVLYLERSPLQVSADVLRPDRLVAQLQALIGESRTAIAASVAEVSASIGHFLAGLALMLFSLIFLLHDGRKIFVFLLRVVPRASRDQVDAAAVRGWRALSHYVRATVIVALSDGLGVLIAALALRVPVAPALAALVFLGAFVPIIGAFVSGTVAVLVALVALGWVKALIMLGAILLVVQIEGHVLQPFILGRAVKLHPLAVVVGIAAGVVVAGIVGALLVVPLMAFAKTFVEHLNGTQQPPLVRALRWPARSRRA